MNIPPIKSMAAVIYLSICFHVTIAAESKKVGEGAYGTVQLYEDPTTHKIFAKKYYRQDLESEIIKKYFAGNTLAQTLNHPGIVKIKEIVRNDPDNQGGMTVCMQYLSGETLVNIIKEPNRNKLETKIMIRNILEIISYLEKNKILHRDLKAENFVSLSPGSTSLALIDWDFATHWMRPHCIYIGTPYYMAPEIIQQQYHYYKQDNLVFNLSKSDTWSAGILIYRLVYSDFPFTHTKSLQDLYTEISKPTPFDIPTTHTNGANISEPLSFLLQKLLDKNPETRWRARTALKESEWLKLPPPREQTEYDFLLRIEFSTKEKKEIWIDPSMSVSACMDEIMLHHKIRKSHFDLYAGDVKMEPNEPLSLYIQKDEGFASVKFHRSE